MSCLVSDGYRINSLPEHIGDACILQGIIDKLRRETKIFPKMLHPVVAKMLLGVLFLAWSESVTEEVTAPMDAEYIEVDH